MIKRLEMARKLKKKHNVLLYYIKTLFNLNSLYYHKIIVQLILLFSG